MRIRAFCLTIFCTALASAQSYTISTVVGTGPPNNVPAKTTNFGENTPVSLTADSKGDVYFIYQSSVIRLDPVSGLLTLVAGNGTDGYSGDNGPATGALLNEPGALTLDASGNLYIADSGNSVVRKISGGIITTIAGTGRAAPNCTDGPAASTPLNNPLGIAVDAAGNVYIADTGDNCVHKLSQGNLTRVAGTGATGYFGDGGPATQALLNRPEALALDPTGDIYLADLGNYVVREIAAATGKISTIAGNGQCCALSTYSGSATQAELIDPAGLAVDSTGNLYLSDAGVNVIVKITNGSMSIVAGTPGSSYGFSDGPVQVAKMDGPSGIAFDGAGNLYFCDSLNQRIREITAGAIATIAGTGGYGDGGPANQAVLSAPQYVTLDAAENLYFSDVLTGVVRKVSAATGIITTVAGNPAGAGTFFNGASATSVPLVNNLAGVAVDAAGNLYIANNANLVIYKVSNGQIFEVPGSGQGNTVAIDPQSTLFLGAEGLAVDSADNLFFADVGIFLQTTNPNERVPVLGHIVELSNGVDTNLGGNGTPGSGGIGGLAVDANLATPQGVVLDSADDVYFADAANCQILRIDSKTGILTAVAGTGTCGFTGEGAPAISAELKGPIGVALDKAGNIYIADSLNNRIRKVTAATGIITTIAGTGAYGFSGDNGPATSAELRQPVGITVDSAGNVFVVDSERIRVLTPSTGSGCTYSVSAASLNPTSSGGSESINVQTGYYCPWTVTGLPSWISLSGPVGGTGNGAAALTVAANTGVARSAIVTIAGQPVTISQAGAVAAPTITLVANAEGEVPIVAPNTWVEIKGTDLAPAGDTRIWAASDFVNSQLPTNLDGVSVTVNGVPAYIYYISPTQVNVLTPPGALSGSVEVVLTNGTPSAPFTVQAQAESPSFFVFNGGPYIAATHLNGGYIGPTTLYPGLSTPVTPGETIVIYANGFGATSVPVVAGAETQSGTLSPLPVITIGGVAASVTYAGSSGAPGEFQFNVVVPSTLAAGDQPIIATYNGLSTQKGTLVTVQ
jgi:uncharacterized protein (TIGR03437 family)